MPISTTNSTATVAYFQPDGTPITDGSQEGDGREFARVTVTVRDAVSAPVPFAQVFVQQDSAMPDPTLRIDHPRKRPDNEGAVAFADAFGIAEIEVRTFAGELGPITLLVRAGEDDGKIKLQPEPTAANTGAGATTTTLNGPQTYAVDGQIVEDTAFDSVVTITGENVTFRNCSFDVSSTAGSNSVRSTGEGVIFNDCTFTGCTGHALVGFGFAATGCLFTQIGLSAIFISDTLGQVETQLVESVCERNAFNQGTPCVTISPGSKIRILRNRLHSPHEDSQSAVSGYRGRGGIWILSRRPFTASDIVIEGNWIYGGENEAVRIEPLDSGYKPSGVRIVGNRFGPASLYQDPAGEGKLITLDAVGSLIQGNVDDETGALIDENTIDGLAWYHPGEFLDASPSVSFGVRRGALAALEFMPNLEPLAIPEARFNSGAHRFGPLAQLFIRSPLGDPSIAGAFIDENTDDDELDFPSGEGGSLDLGDGLPGVDDFYYPVPTACLYAPTRTTSPDPVTPTVQFAADDVNRSGFEGTSVSLTIESDRPATELIEVVIDYSGSALFNTDYTGPDIVTIPTGQSSAELTLQLLRDDITDLNEIATIRLTFPINAVIGERDESRLRITDSYKTSEPEPFNANVEISTPLIVVGEGVIGRFDVLLERIMPDPVTVTYVIEDSTMEPGEYSDLTGGSVTIADGDLSGVIAIQSVDDAIVEGTEQLSVRLTGVTAGNAVLTENDTGVFRVFDNDNTPQSEVGFAQVEGQIFEGGSAQLIVQLSQPAFEAIELPITPTYLDGLGPAEVVLFDETNDEPLGASIRFEEGQSTLILSISSIDDDIVETTERVRLTLGEVTSGPGELGNQSTYTLSILDNDTSGPGADGDLYGLVPERQDLDLSTPDVEVYPDRYEIIANAGLGISASTVNVPDNPLPRAMRAAQEIWEAKNSANMSALQARAGILDEGEVVKIRVNGAMGTSITRIGGNSLTGSDAVTWNAPARPFIRDLCIYGATGRDTDSMGHIQPIFKSSLQINSGEFSGRGRSAANIRFERIGIIGNTGFQSCVRSATDGDPTDIDAIFGAMKFYDCRFRQPLNPGTSNFGRGIKWVVRCSQRAAWDFRGNFAELAEEHFVYVNSPQGHFYSINNTMPRGGYGRTFNQIVNRKLEVPGLPGQGRVVWMRNTIWDNCSDEVQQGGGDLTCVGFHGSVHLVENMHLGKAKAASSSNGRAALSIWSAAEWTFNGVWRYESGGGTYLTGDVHIWGEVANWENGNHRGVWGISCAESIDLRGFAALGVHQQTIFRLDNAGNGGANSVEFANGVPATNPAHGFFWNLNFPEWTDGAWGGTPSDYPGFPDNGGQKLTSRRNARLANDNTNFHVLSDAEVDAFDGTAPWPLGQQLPQAAFERRTLGVPIGGTELVRFGNFSRARSIRPQTWTYERTLTNIGTGSFAEGRNELITFNAGTGAGSTSFVLMDDEYNLDDSTVKERAEIGITPSAAGDDPSQPGIINYRLIDAGANANIVDPNCDVFVYGPGAFGTFGWRTPELQISISDGPIQFVQIDTSAATQMVERVTVSKNVGLTTTASTGINNFNWNMNQGATSLNVRIVSIDNAQPGDVLVIDIDAIETGGVTSGNIGASQIQIQYVP